MLKVIGCFAAALVATAAFVSATIAAEDKKPETVYGVIQAADEKAHTLILVSKGETKTEFKVAVENEGNREAAHILLDGKRATFEDAVQAKRTAAVTFLQVGNERWVWKVDVKSAK